MSGPCWAMVLRMKVFALIAMPYAVRRAPCVVRRWPNGDSEELGGGARGKLEWERL